MEHPEDQFALVNLKDDLCNRVAELVGYQPPGLRVLLRVLAHPEIIQHVRRYFEALDTTTKCLNYEPPWSCAREAEARYENIKYGWLGGINGVGHDESWCPNCRKRVFPDA